MEIGFLIFFVFFFTLFASEERALEELQRTLDCPLSSSVTVKKLAGMTNENFLVLDKEKKYFVRLPGFETARFIDRFSENYNSQHAYQFYFNPANCLFCDSEKGVRITEYIEGFSTLKFEDVYEEEVLANIASLLLSIHSSAMPFKNTIDIFERIRLLTDVLIERTVHFPKEYFLAKKEIEKLKPLLAAPLFERVPTHGDPVPGNFLVFHDRLMLFDWEYSGLNDPAWDLAFLASVMDFPHDLERKFISLYSGFPCDLLHAKLIFFKPIIEFWLGLWGLLQSQTYEDSDEKAFFSYFALAHLRKSLNFFWCPEKQITSQHLMGDLPPPKPAFNHWVCPSCGILNSIQKIHCVGRNCPSKVS